MDRLSEIRARCDAAKAQKEKGDSITAACIAWSIVANDIPYLLSEVDRLSALHKREIIITGEYAQRVIDLTARAEAAEARADAAVEDLKLALIDESLDPCQCCEYGGTDHCTHPDGPTCGESGGKNWKWRGHQEAGKGEAE